MNGNGNSNGDGNTSLALMPPQSVSAPTQGYSRPTITTYGRTIEPGLDGVVRAPSGEMQLGSRNFFVQNLDRDATPELANANYALLDPAVYAATAQAMLPFCIPIQGGFTRDAADYNEIANGAYFRAGAALVGAMGRNDQSAYPATVSGNVFTMTDFSLPNLILGVTIEWSLQLQISSAFTMDVAATNFRGQSWQNLDRRFSLRIGNSQGVSGNGGIFAFLFAQRQSQNETCGDPTARGGMQIAIAQPAYLGPVAGNITNDNIAPPDAHQHTFSIGELGQYLPGLTQGLTPAVAITVPSSITTGFSCQARLITAGSPYLAQVRAALKYE